MKIISLIPARGGSKAIKKKNIKLMAGEPLIHYAISASLDAKKIDRTIVSTDDKEIVEIAKSNGAETPFLRPSELAQDNILDYPVINHCINYLINEENVKWLTKY